MLNTYKCDPDKNFTCPKRGCVYNPNARYQVCDCTVYPEYAKLDADGKPILSKRTPIPTSRFRLSEADISNLQDSIHSDLELISRGEQTTDKPVREYFHEEIEYAAYYLRDKTESGPYQIVIGIDRGERVSWRVEKRG